MKYRNFLVSSKAKVSEWITYQPDAAHAVFLYDLCLEAAGRQAGKRVDALVIETAKIPMGEAWMVEVKDFRRMFHQPNPDNSTDLDKTVERKMADSHRFLMSDTMPQAISKPYRVSSGVHYCFHIELPELKDMKQPWQRLTYSALVSITRAMATGRVVKTPNHSPLEVLNATLINGNSAYPWQVVLT